MCSVTATEQVQANIPKKATLKEIGITVWSAVETDHQVLLVSPMQPPDKSCWISIVLVSRSRGGCLQSHCTMLIQQDLSGGRLGLTSKT
jgi:hypothetical protein